MNIHASHASGGEELDALCSCLAHRDRRAVLETLYDRAPEALTPRALARTLRESRPSLQSADSLRKTVVALKHAHLPKLESAGLVERDAGRVRSAEHEALRDTDLGDVLADRSSGPPGSLDAFFDALASHRRRTVLGVLDQHAGPVEVGTLARTVRIAEQATAEQPGNTRKQVRTSLHHNHLPKLADAGLVSYDFEEQTVAYEGHPLLEANSYVSSLVCVSSGA